MDQQEVRRTNMLKLIDERFRNDTDAARATGLNRAVISQIRNGHKKVGDRLARSVEQAFGLPYRALDAVDMRAGQQEEEAAAANTAPDDIAAEMRQLPDSVRIPLELLIRSLAAQQRRIAPRPISVPAFHASFTQDARQVAVAGE